MAERALACWGVDLDEKGVLAIGGVSTEDLADQFGTPLHVVNCDRLQTQASEFLRAFKQRYPGHVEAFFAAKCNSVCGVLQALKHVGFGAEVFTPFELRLARLAQMAGQEIIVNGAGKTRDFLAACVAADVKLVVADSLQEITLLHDIARTSSRCVDVLLRVNLGFVPRDVNPGAATAGKKSMFGMEVNELSKAAEFCRNNQFVRFCGLHMHIGSNIRRAEDYRRACTRLCEVACRLYDTTGVSSRYLDVGGGFGTPMVREYSALEFILYHGLGRLPGCAAPEDTSTIEDFAQAVSVPIVNAYRARNWPLPTILVEPGRCLVSPNQLLLLRVLARKKKPAHRDYVVTNGGQITVNFPTFHEYHAILACKNPFGSASTPMNVVGAGCYAADFVCRNVPMPEVAEGDLLAVMDSGAYFLSFEGNFGFPRAGVVAVIDGKPVVLRSLESYTDMLARERPLPQIA